MQRICSGHLAAVTAWQNLLFYAEHCSEQEQLEWGKSNRFDLAGQRRVPLKAPGQHQITQQICSYLESGAAYQH